MIKVDTKHIAIIVVVVVSAIVGYLAWRKWQLYRAKATEAKAVADEYAQTSWQNEQIAEEYDLSVEEVAEARDVAFNLSMIFETNKDLSWLDKNSDLLWTVISPAALLLSELSNEDEDTALRYLQKVSSRESVQLVAALYEADFTENRDFKADLSEAIAAKKLRRFKGLKYLP